MKYLFTFARLRLLFLFGLLLAAATAHAQSWQWATVTGAGNSNSTVVDAAGNVYVTGVTISVSGPLAPVPAITPTAGTYSMPALVSTGAYTLTPSKSNDVARTNGVTVTDVALVQRHILGGGLLGAAYKAVSADVNNDATINVADVAGIQSFILGNTTSFTGGALWRFFSSSQTFTNQNSPWPLLQTRTYTSLTTSTAQDFVGCKLGDVNDSWNPAIARPAGAAPDTLPISLGSGAVAANGRLRIPLIVGAGPACGGLQGEIAWDPAVLRLTGTATLRPGVVVGVADTAAGHLPLLWTDPAGRPLHGPATLVEIEFEALGTPNVLTQVQLVDGPRTALLGLDSALAPLALRVGAGTVSIGPLGVGAATSGPVVGLWPNPAHETVRLAGPLRAAVAVVDALGRTVRTAQLDAAGAATLTVRGLPTGVYVVRIGAVARRLVVE